MEKIRILSCIASPDWCFDPGRVVRVGTKFVTNEEVPREYAEAWVSGGVVAEVVEVDPPAAKVVRGVEEVQERTATAAEEPEAAVKQRPARRTNKGQGK